MYATGNDHNTEQLLNIERNAVQCALDKIEGLMGSRLRLARFSNWSQEYEMQIFSHIGDAKNPTSFGQIGHSDYGRHFLNRFKRRYNTMREFNPLLYAYVVTTRSLARDRTQSEYRVLQERRDCFSSSAWERAY